MESLVKVNSEECDLDFVWDAYLETTKSHAAHSKNFSHVEYSLVSKLKIGMKMEVPNTEEDKCYWVASVVMICGPLLSLRYLGYGDERTADFWSDLSSGEFHPIGWCQENNFKLYPPKGVRTKHTNFMSLLEPALKHDSIPNSLLKDPESGSTPIDQIKPEMLVEVEDEFNCGNVWPARIIQNVGGRLLLRYENMGEIEDMDFWLFYLSERIHPINYAKHNGKIYLPPDKTQMNLSYDEINNIISACVSEAEEYPFPAHVLEPQIQISKHKFKVNMKLEVLNPVTMLDFRPASVTKVINDKHFLIAVDTGEKKSNCPVMSCHAASLTIFPCNWAYEHGLSVVDPEGTEKFEWIKYLSQRKAIPAPVDLFQKNFLPSELRRGMKLEAVNLARPNEIHAATIEDVIDPLVWIQFDSCDSSRTHHIVPANSFDVFPVGWCASNAYPLNTPAVSRTKSLHIQGPQTADPNSKSNRSSPYKATGAKSWCPKIYFNHCCFTGPYLSKNRLAELPKTIGPGPLHLVMKEVLTRLINIAYKSSRVLKELQISGKPDPSMLQQTIKAKYKGKSYRATVEFISNSEQVEEFCGSICKKLECCPHLFGPHHVGKNCPDNCSTQTKTKFSNGLMKKLKKPSTSADDPLEKKGPGRRKKRKHWRLIQAENAKKEGNKDDTGDNSTSPKEQSLKSSDTEEEEEQPKKKLRECSDSESKTKSAKESDEVWKQENVEPSSKEDAEDETTNVQSGKKKGRPVGSTKKAIAATLASKRLAQQREVETINRTCRVLQEAEQIGLPSNPVKWSIDDVVKYIRSTPCASMAYILREQEIDGQALLMLTLYSVQEFLHLKAEPARLFCSIVEKIKYEFFLKFSTL